MVSAVAAPRGASGTGPGHSASCVCPGDGCQGFARALALQNATATHRATGQVFAMRRASPVLAGSGRVGALLGVYEGEHRVVRGDLVVDEAVAAGAAMGVVPAGGEAGVAAAEDVGAEAIADDERGWLRRRAEAGEGVLEDRRGGLGDPELGGDGDGAEVAGEVEPGDAGALDVGQAVGDQGEREGRIGGELVEDVAHAGVELADAFAY